MSKVLLKYIPSEALPLIQYWYNELNFHLRITKTRKTKFGDFRPAFNGKPNRISVNGDLNQYHFLITLVHEIAHVACWEKYNSKVNPHGREWKGIYSNMLREIKEVVPLPTDIKLALKEHLKLPKASSCSDPELFKILKKYNPESDHIFLDSLDEGKSFIFQNDRVFRKGKKRRTRIECLELSSGKTYLISGHAEVLQFDE